MLTLYTRRTRSLQKTGRVINFSLIAELQFQKWDDLVKKIAEIEKGNMGNMTAMQQVKQFQMFTPFLRLLLPIWEIWATCLSDSR